MRYLRIAVIGIFILSLGVGLWSNYQYKQGKDYTPPIIQCDSEYIELIVSDGDDAIMKGITAYDAVDGDLTDKIMVASTSHFFEQGTFKVRYVVFDSQNNSAMLTRTVHYMDYVAPQFSLSQPLVYTRGDDIHYLDYVTVYDVLDGDITDRIKVKSSYVSSYTADIYPVLLEVSNSYGDTVQVELNVVVQEANANTVDIVLEQYLVYIKQGEQFNANEYILSVKNSNGTILNKDNVNILGKVDTNEAGCYQLAYNYSDGSVQGWAYMTVVVVGEDR